MPRNPVSVEELRVRVMKLKHDLVGNHRIKKKWHRGTWDMSWTSWTNIGFRA